MNNHKPKEEKVNNCKDVRCSHAGECACTEPKAPELCKHGYTADESCYYCDHPETTDEEAQLYLDLLAAWGDSPIDEEGVREILKSHKCQMPCDVSGWMRIGKERGYWDFFKKQED